MAITYLTTKYILDSNATWARTDLGPLDELTNSIREHGVLEPLLLEKDFFMLDGARRLTAAIAAGLKTVPVIICHSWAEFLEHFRPTEPDCLPMDWVDLPNLWGVTFKRIRAEYKRANALATRKSTSTEIIQHTYSLYTHELAAIYRVEPSTIKLLRDYLTRMRRQKDKYPVLVNGLYSRFPHGEEARDLTRCRYIKSVLERVRLGELTEEEALMIYDIRSKDSGPTHTYRRSRAHSSIIDTDAKPITVHQLDKLVTMVEQVGVTAETFKNFNITDNVLITEYIARLRESVSYLSSMRRRLETLRRM